MFIQISQLNFSILLNWKVEQMFISHLVFHIAQPIISYIFFVFHFNFKLQDVQVDGTPLLQVCP